MRILCLDQSGLTGWCLGDVGADPKPAHGSNIPCPVHGVQRLPGSLTGPRKAKALHRFLVNLMRDNAVEKVFFEEPIIPKATGFVTLYGLFGLATAIGWAADDLGLACSAIRQQTWRSEAGVPTQAPRKIKGTDQRRKWMKARAVERARNLGFDLTDDNEAEASLMWWAMSQRIIRREAQAEMDFSSTLTI